MLNKLLAALCCAALLPSIACARDDGTDSSVAFIQDVRNFVVQRDGSFVMTREVLLQINEERAVRPESQRTLSFNRTLEDGEVIEAYNEKPDGRRIVVQPDQIKLQQENQDAGAPMFQDMLVKTIIYPDVAVGDKLYSKVRVMRRSAQYPGQFSDAAYPAFSPTREFSLTYDLPADMPLHAAADGFNAAPVSALDGRVVYRWTYSPSDNARTESESVDYADYGRHLVVSTFDDYTQLGRAYYQGAAGMATPGSGIKAQVQSLVGDLHDPRAKALAISNWVRKNIRYVAVYIGNGGIVPHQAETVLANRYGDCKDHVSLLEAMLSEAGIDSTPALISYGNSFALLPVPNPGLFNHVITYVPSLDLYLDSTAEDVEAGYLPPAELGKQVILTQTGEVGHTPVAQAGQTRSHFNVRIAADGSARFVYAVSYTGLWEEVFRWGQHNWKEVDRAMQVENVLKEKSMRGGGSFEPGDFEHSGKGYTFTMRGTAENWAYLPGTVGVPTDSGLWRGLSDEVFGLTHEVVRTQPYLCPVSDVAEDASFELPPGASVLALPRDTHIASPYFQYQSKFRRTGQIVHVQRSFKSGKKGSRVCTPQDFAAMQEDIRIMVRDLRSQYILSVPEPRVSAGAAKHVNARAISKAVHI